MRMKYKKSGGTRIATWGQVPRFDSKRVLSRQHLPRTRRSEGTARQSHDMRHAGNTVLEPKSHVKLTRGWLAEDTVGGICCLQKKHFRILPRETGIGDGLAITAHRRSNILSPADDETLHHAATHHNVAVQPILACPQHRLHHMLLERGILAAPVTAVAVACIHDDGGIRNIALGLLHQLCGTCHALRIVVGSRRAATENQVCGTVPPGTNMPPAMGKVLRVLCALHAVHADLDRSLYRMLHTNRAI